MWMGYRREIIKRDFSQKQRDKMADQQKTADHEYSPECDCSSCQAERGGA